MFATVVSVLEEELSALEKLPAAQLVKERREKFYEMGVWTE
jgi:acetyl-CoA carboxylase alpha subunit